MVPLLPCQVEGSPAPVSSCARLALQKLFLVWWLDHELFLKLLLDQKLLPNQKLSRPPPPASQVHLALVPLELKVLDHAVLFHVFLDLVVLCRV